MQRMFARILQCQMAPVHALSLEGMDLLRRLLDPNPATRLSVQQALQHPWVTTDMPPGLQVRDCSEPRPSVQLGESAFRPSAVQWDISLV